MFCDLKNDLNNPNILRIFTHSVYGNSIERAKEKIKSYLENDTWHIFGWLENDTVHGVCGFIAHSDKIEITNIAVAKHSRRHGIGRKMIFEIYNKYETIIEVETDDDTVDFYRKCGFEAVSLQKYGVRRWKCILFDPIFLCQN